MRFLKRAVIYWYFRKPGIADADFNKSLSNSAAKCGDIACLKISNRAMFTRDAQGKTPPDLVFFKRFAQDNGIPPKFAPKLKKIEN